MYNIKALEEEWRRYKRKKRIPLIVGMLAIVMGAGGTVFFIKNRSGILQSDAAPKQQAGKSDIDIYIDKGISDIAEKSANTLIDAPIEVAAITEGERVTESSSNVKKKFHIEVIDTSVKQSSFKEIEKRFRMGHDIDDSLFLAKSYYQQKNYKKAEYWALQTNKVNENIEEGWLIFAKAKAKQGQKNEAIRILNAYIKRTNSIEAKVLLDNIKKGKI